MVSIKKTCCLRKLRRAMRNRIPIVMDVDTGTDDAIAIICALLNKDKLDIKAFTTVAGNVGVDLTSRNTLNIVDYLGFDIPVAIGASKPLKRDLHLAVSHGKSGLGDVVVTKSQKSFYGKDAADTIYEMATIMDGKLEILAVGPLTNIAQTIRRYPKVTSMIKKITIMGGALAGGNMTQTSEFNTYVDPEAAKIVFESEIPLVMIGLDVTLHAKLPDSVYETVKNMDNKFAKLATQIFDYMIRRGNEFRFDPPNLHDVVALAYVVIPEVITLKKYYLTVETQGIMTRGMTVADFNDVLNKKPNISAAVDINLDMFWKWLTRELSNLN